MEIRNFQFFRDVLVTALLAAATGLAATVPPFDHFGGISLALLAGMLTKAFFWKPDSNSAGLAFAAKTLLRVGIVLLGFRLNFAVLTQAGPQVLLFDLFMVILGVALVAFVLRRAGFEPALAALAAVGSSICGASAIAAVAPGLRANKESSALAIVVCTLVGTIATFLLIPLQSIAGLAPAQYGILAGATLHEVAQVVAAVAPVPDAFQTGIATKLLRVVFLAPVVVLLPRIIRKPAHDQTQSQSSSTSKPQVIPWYVAGFLLAGLLVTLASNSPEGIQRFVSAGTVQLAQPTNLLIAASLAAIGLQVDFSLLRKHGPKLLLLAAATWSVLFSTILALCLIWK
jgi:uncharacterized integral membrane protein (TIGR00698 family)